ncbi:MAG: pantetheine-phosphate adenylyltransferase [Candidatus Omnitrophica bacterium]|nr:pantetheine-phosphate adenylyltransferase [Candidatus Omnitrophota bacterium]MDD5670652.1 pantetheine-phosphate adenylyltransferase [Candidatus Omnitrophota bacterium]
MEKRRAIYPGSFDPVTNGHLDLIQRARHLFDEVYVLLVVNPEKQTLFTMEERLGFLRQACRGMAGVSVDSFEGLTVEYAKEKKARTIIRGLRVTSDFDYEFQMAMTNRKLSKQVDTIFLMPSETHFYISSRLTKEIASLKGNISEYVPEFVAEKLYERLG